VASRTLGTTLIVLTLAACSPAQRQAIGAGTSGIGLATATVGGVLVDPCLFDSDGDARRTSYSEKEPCRSSGSGQEGAAPKAGGLLIAVGLSVALLGGIVWGTGGASPNAGTSGALVPRYGTPDPWPEPQRTTPEF
jgi:hypothetical protein